MKLKCFNSLNLVENDEFVKLAEVDDSIEKVKMFKWFDLVDMVELVEMVELD